MEITLSKRDRDAIVHDLRVALLQDIKKMMLNEIAINDFLLLLIVVLGLTGLVFAFIAFVLAVIYILIDEEQVEDRRHIKHEFGYCFKIAACLAVITIILIIIYA